MYDAASTILQQKISQIKGVGQVFVGGGSAPAVRVDVNPTLLNDFGWASKTCARCWPTPTRISPKGSSGGSEPNLAAEHHGSTDEGASEYAPADRRVSQRRGGAAVRYRRGDGFGLGHSQRGIRERQARRAGLSSSASRRRISSTRWTACKACCRSCKASIPACDQRARPERPHHHDPRFGSRRAAHHGHLHGAGRSWWCSCSCAASAPR